jgi:hypothetical protein
LCFAGIGISNARLFLRVQKEKQQNQVSTFYDVRIIIISFPSYLLDWIVSEHSTNYSLD